MKHKIALPLVIVALGIANGQDGGILFPDKDGYDIGMVLISETCFSWEQYELLGQTLQQYSELRLWIYLSDNYIDPTSWLCSSDNISRVCDTSGSQSFIQIGRDVLVSAGLPLGAPLYTAGHGCGGSIVQEEVKLDPEAADGVILIGQKLSEGDYKDYPTPAMVVNGDLDGIMRFVSVTLSFRDQYHTIEGGQQSSVYSYPHVVLDGVNHSQFTTGNVPEYMDHFHIRPEVEDEESRHLLSEAMTTFLDYQTNVTNTSRSRERLERYYNVMRAEVEPVYRAFDLECDRPCTESLWATVGQEVIADINDTNVNFEILNTVFDEDSFGSSYASVQSLGENTVLLNTTANLPVTDDTEYLYEASLMIQTKFKTRQAILEELTGEDLEFEPTKFCQDVNKAAWDLIWNEVIPAKQKSRYLHRNVTVTFLEDERFITGVAWLESVLLFDFNGEDLIIQSTTLLSRTNPENDRFFGMHYCKMVSPAKLLEFIYIDALYETYYTGIF